MVMTTGTITGAVSGPDRIRVRIVRGTVIEGIGPVRPGDIYEGTRGELFPLIYSGKAELVAQLPKTAPDRRSVEPIVDAEPVTVAEPDPEPEQKPATRGRGRPRRKSTKA